MEILNFGSLNIDHVYEVDDFVQPGETIRSQNYRQFCGGKGQNQSIALAYAGARVSHAGCIGTDGLVLKERLEAAGVDTRFVEIIDGASGHAVIQVNREGENAIIINGGANETINAQTAAHVVSAFSAGDYLLLQNEISAIPYIMQEGADKGLQIIFNPAPMTAAVQSYPLHLVSIFVLNEIEGQALTGEVEPDGILNSMLRRHPDAGTVLTRGKNGASYSDRKQQIHVAAPKVNAVDTTAAGDTFIGYMLAGLAYEKPIEGVLETACRAAALCVTRPGAAESIPTRQELGRLDW
jgi:ribokinase